MKEFKNRLYKTSIVLVFLLISGCSGSLVADVTPPPGYQPTIYPQSTAYVQAEISPLLPPDSRAGEDVYSQNCLACHGTDGKGNGNRVESLPSPPPMLGSLSYSRKIAPVIWYQTITQGRMDKLMPGFGTSLSDRQRWDVTAYLLSLDISASQMTNGEAVYRQTCQTCHGEKAEGISGSGPELTGADQLQRSLNDTINIITFGKNTMPAVGKDLPDEQKIDAAIYVRSLVMTNPAGEEKSSNVENKTPLPDFTDDRDHDSKITGRVINGSGASLPNGLLVTLTGFDSDQEKYTQSIPVDINGYFSFHDVPVPEGRIYQLSVLYKDVLYSSTPIQAGNTTAMENQQITIYEPITDTALIKAARMHIFFEFPKANVLRVIQLFVLSNPTKNLITSAHAGDPVITFQLPDGASNLMVKGGSLGGRFVSTSDGFGDTQGIPPGTGTQILFSYDLPYDKDLLFYIKLPLNIDVTNIMLPSEGVTIKSSQLNTAGEKLIQNTEWRIYSSGPLTSGSRLDLLVSGKPVIDDPQADEMNTNLAVGLLAVVVVSVFVIIAILQEIGEKKAAKKQKPIPPKDISAQNTVLDAIIALDDQFKAGQIPPAAYKERREELLKRLQEALA